MNATLAGPWISCRKEEWESFEFSIIGEKTKKEEHWSSNRSGRREISHRLPRHGEESKSISRFNKKISLERVGNNQRQIWESLKRTLMNHSPDDPGTKGLINTDLSFHLDKESLELEVNLKTTFWITRINPGRGANILLFPYFKALRHWSYMCLNSANWTMN